MSRPYLSDKWNRTPLPAHRPKKDRSTRLRSIAERRKPCAIDIAQLALNMAQQPDRNSLSIYCLRIRETDFCKIGVSQDPHNRFRSIAHANPTQADLLIAAKVKSARLLEHWLHQKYHAKRTQSLGREWFALSPKDRAYICQLIASFHQIFRQQAE